MSTFDGLVKEIEGISVDSFEEQNLGSSIFFLSHIHSDHMRGFSSKDFKLKMQEPEIYLYASPVTIKMLQQWLPECSDRFRSLSVDSPEFIKHPRTKKVITVRTVPAGHCLGSIMFLFEYSGKTVLYTGDFRINTGELPKFHQFNNSVGELKRIDKVYLDATFCLEKYRSFPSRDESIEAVYRACQEWLELDKRNNVIVSIPAYFGSEALLMELSKRFRMPIYIGEKNFEIYRYLPNVDGVFTRFEETTRISAYFQYKEDWRPEFCRIVRPTARVWSDWKKGENITFKRDSYNVAVCYSSHSSYEEIVEFLRYLKPAEVKSIVEKKEIVEEIYHLIDECVKSYQKPNNSPVKTKPIQFNLTLPAPVKRQIVEDDIVSQLDSPPKKKR